MTFDPLARFLNQKSARFERRALLRPMSSSQVVDASLQVYRALGGRILFLTLIPALFSTVAIYFLLDYVIPMLGSTSDPTNVETQIGEAVFVVALALFVALPLIIFSASYAGALACNLVSDHVNGLVPSPQAAQDVALRNIGRIFLFGVRQAILGAGGLILGTVLLIAGAMVDTSYPDASGWIALLAILAFGACFVVAPLVFSFECLTIPVMIIEGSSVRKAALRSRQLLKSVGRNPSGMPAVSNLFAMVIVLLLLLTIGIGSGIGILVSIADVAAWLETSLGADLSNKLLQIVPTFLAVWLLVPVWSVTSTLIYFERRVRLEGYDIEALAQDVWRSDRSHRFEL